MTFSPSQIGSFAQEISNLIGINNWQLQECSYNGAQFHWMQPAYNGLDPAASIVNYIESAFSSTASQKPDYGTWANALKMSDSVSKKLCIFPVPNMSGDFIDDFGLTGVDISIYGMIYGPSYMQVLDKCSSAFLDVQDPNQTTTYGKVTQQAYLQLNHVIYGLINNVYLRDYKILTTNEYFQSAVFELMLRVQNPSYLYTNTAPSNWQTEIQSILNGAEGGLAGIMQSFSLGQSLSGFGIGVGDTNTNNPIPVVNGTGQYLASVIKDITNHLASVADVFTNSMAFLVQNSGDQVANSFWDSITIDYSVLPLYLLPNQTFSQSDAQVVISYFNTAVNNFISYANERTYSYNLQNNIQSMAQCLVYLNNFSQTVLSKNRPSKTVKLDRNNDIYSLMNSNNVALDNLDLVSSLNAGTTFSLLTIPIGAEVIL